MSNLKKISNWLKRKNIHDQSDVSKQLTQLKKKYEELELAAVIEFEKSIQEYLEIQWEARVGTKSKLGGNPDLPEGIAWPTVGDIPMSFIGQIALSETNHNQENDLPKTGMLYFFLNLDRIDNLPGDFVGNEMYYFGENLQVIYHPDEGELNQTAAPKGLLKAYTFQENPIMFKHALMPVPAEVLPEYNLIECDEYWEEYCDMELYVGKSGLLFHPFASQDDLSDSYQEMLNEMGIYSDDEEIITLFTFVCYDDKNVFLPLDDLGFSAGYFGICVSDLRERNFENVVFCFQS